VGLGDKYGQSYGLDDVGAAGGGGVAYSFTRAETVTAVDGVTVFSGIAYAFREDEVVQVLDGTVIVQGDYYARRSDEVVTANDFASISPKDYHYREDEVVAAQDDVTEDTSTIVKDWPTSKAPSKRGRYEPVVDLNMVRASLTNRGRFYLARGIHDGTIVQPVAFDLGGGWENPRWGEPPQPSADSTEVSNKVFSGSIYDGHMVLEEANPSTLAICIKGEVAPDYEATEVMVYAKILNSPYDDETHREIPFACATFPSWFHTPGQMFSSRLIIPLGTGVKVPTIEIPHRIRHEIVNVVDSVCVELNNWDVFSLGGDD
jgi:hypothetical protein